MSLKFDDIHIFFSVVCAWCSDKTDYVPGYGDERVRLCDTCVRDKKLLKQYRNSAMTKSFISGQFDSNKVPRTNNF